MRVVRCDPAVKLKLLSRKPSADKKATGTVMPVARDQRIKQLVSNSYMRCRQREVNHECDAFKGQEQ